MSLMTEIQLIHRWKLRNLIKRTHQLSLHQRIIKFIVNGSLRRLFPNDPVVMGTCTLAVASIRPNLWLHTRYGRVALGPVTRCYPDPHNVHRPEQVRLETGTRPRQSGHGSHCWTRGQHQQWTWHQARLAGAAVINICTFVQLHEITFFLHFDMQWVKDNAD